MKHGFVPELTLNTQITSHNLCFTSIIVIYFLLFQFCFIKNEIHIYNIYNIYKTIYYGIYLSLYI